MCILRNFMDSNVWFMNAYMYSSHVQLYLHSVDKYSSRNLIDIFMVLRYQFTAF
jgi:hypothetical protein